MEQNGKVFNLGSLLFIGILSLGSFLYCKNMLPREENYHELDSSFFLSFHDRSLILSIRSKLLYRFHFLLKTASL